MIRRTLQGAGVGAVLMRGAAGSAGAHAAGAGIAFLAQIVLARILGVSQYGYYVYAFTWTSILAQICRLGFQNSLIRFVASYRSECNWGAIRGIVLRSLQLILAAAVMAALLMATVPATFPDIASPQQVRTFQTAALVLVPLALLGATQGILQGYKRPAQAILPFRALLQGITLSLTLIAYCAGLILTATEAMGLTAVAAVMSLAVAGWWVKRSVGPDVRSRAAEYKTKYWLRISLPLLLMVGMHLLLKQTDTVMLGALAGTDAAGLYFPLARISELAAFGLVSVNAIAAPLISELYTEGRRIELQRLLTLSAIGSSVVTAVAVLSFWILGKWVLALFGTEFVAGYGPLMVLLSGQVINGVCGPAAFVMVMLGHQDRASLVVAGSALANVMLNWELIPAYGIMGAAIATAISSAVSVIWMVLEVGQRHQLNTTPFVRPRPY